MNEPNGEDKSFKEKVKRFIESLKIEENTDRVLHFASGNMRDTLAYILMLTGIFLLFFEPYYAAALIGVIFGLYFTQEIVYVYHHYPQLIQQIGPTRSLLLGGLILALFISVPFLFFGAIVAVAVRQLLA